MDTKWIMHKGKRILHVTYGGSTGEKELIDYFLCALDMAVKEPNKVLNLADFTNTYITSDFLDTLKQKGKDIMIKKFEKIALLGVDGIKNIFLNSYLIFTNQRNIRTFNALDEALEWLAE
jgi:hypothetical protein